jgi:hypothetical protein
MSSCKWLKEQAPEFAGFDWQDGFGAFSLGMSQKKTAVRYIRHQQKHHAAESYQQEFRTLLDAYDVDYDERYVWG